MSLIEHLERRLGPVQGGWNKGPGGEPMPFQIVRCSGGDVLPDVTSYATAGLADHPLPTGDPDRHVHHELLICVDDEQSDGPFPAILQQIAGMLMGGDSALLRGEVLGPYGPVVEGSAMEAFYAAAPVLFDDGFAVVEPGGDGRRFEIVVIWLAPIGKAEAAFVDERGWEAFEEELVRQQPDLTDLRRPEISLEW